MSTPVYRGPALLLADGLEIPVQVELTGNVPELGLPGWTGVLESGDTRFSSGTVRSGRLRLPGGLPPPAGPRGRRRHEIQARPAAWPRRRLGPRSVS